MGLINAGKFLSVVQAYRLVWISGRFGGGKTSLAFKLAETWLQKGYRLITNGRCVWADSLDEIDFVDEFGHLRAVVILDEGGLEFKAGKQIEQIAAYAAKMDCIYLLPSFWPPVRLAQVVTCQPLFSFNMIGLPLIVYKWQVKLGGFSEDGYFLWWWPKEVYGLYSRQDPGDVAADIVEFLAGKSDEFRSLYGRGSNRLSAVEVSEAEIIREAAEQFANAADVVSVAERKRGRRRR